MKMQIKITNDKIIFYNINKDYYVIEKAIFSRNTKYIEWLPGLRTYCKEGWAMLDDGREFSAILHCIIKDGKIEPNKNCPCGCKGIPFIPTHAKRYDI